MLQLESDLFFDTFQQMTYLTTQIDLVLLVNTLFFILASNEQIQ